MQQIPFGRYTFFLLGLLSDFNVLVHMLISQKEKILCNISQVYLTI